jgi:threonyl-tRNA synthetase
MVIVGDKEQEAGSVAPRSHEHGELEAMTVAELVERLEGEYAST